MFKNSGCKKSGLKCSTEDLASHRSTFFLELLSWQLQGMLAPSFSSLKLHSLQTTFCSVCSTRVHFTNSEGQVPKCFHSSATHQCIYLTDHALGSYYKASTLSFGTIREHPRRSLFCAHFLTAAIWPFNEADICLDGCLKPKTLPSGFK